MWLHNQRLIMSVSIGTLDSDTLSSRNVLRSHIELVPLVLLSNERRGYTSTSAKMSQSGHEDEVKVKEEHATASIDSPEETLDVEPEQSPRSVHGWRWILVCFSLYVSSFLYGLDTTIAADVQGAIIESFGNVSALAWVGTGFPLGSVSMTLIIGASYNRFDMKWLYLVSFITFEAASALCGAAPTMDVLIVGRVIAGMGGSGIYVRITRSWGR